MSNTGNKNREQSATALPESNQLRSIILGIGSCLHIIQDYRVVYANPSFCKLINYSESKIKEMPFLDIVHPKDRKLIKILFSDDFNEIRASRSNSFTLRLQTRDKELKWIKSNISIIEWNGRVALLCSSFDITQQKHAEEKFADEEMSYQILVDSFGDLILIINRNGSIIQANQSAQIALGYPENELLLHPFGDIHTGKHKAQIKKILTSVFNENKYLYSTEFISKSGRAIPVDVRMIRGKWKHNDVVYAIAQDITERKRHEAELMMAKRKAEESGKAKEQFLSTMSHEIRTPMNAVIGMTNLLLDENPKPEQLHNLNALKYSAQNLLALLNDILDYNKIGAGKLKIAETSVDLREIHSGIISTYTQMAESKQIKLIGSFDSNIPELVMGDRLRLIQVITNLVGNALKFTEKGSVTLAMKLVRSTSKSAQVQFTVSDTGIGIEKNDQKKIFAEFTQIHGDSTKHLSGTGLGLAISNQLVKLMGGEIKLISQKDVGSTFHFKLKFNIAQHPTPNIIQNATSDNSHVTASNYRILIVEDNELNNLIAEKFLTKWGYQHHSAENGEIALQKIKQHKYDLILMDLEMPVMNGYEATTAIRKLKSKNGKIPIVALSASAMQDVQKKIFDAGMNGFILKPFNPADLKMKIEEVLINKSNQ